MTYPPHLSPVAPVSIRRGLFWVPGGVVESPFGRVLPAPMYVEWEAPAAPTGKPPVIFVHGGGGQGTDWRSTADGRAGWLDGFVAAGFPCYVVDRPGHGRSPAHPALLGAPGAPGGVDMVLGVFARPGFDEGHTQWPWGKSADSAEVLRIAASSGSLPGDLALTQTLDRDRLAELLDLTGPAILITHSLGAPGVLLAAGERPDAVLAIVAIEPAGPPFGTISGIGSLSEGLTSIPAKALRPGLPVSVVRSEVSPFAGAADAIAEHLRGRGAAAAVLALADHGVTGNGHGVMLEANSDDAAVPILDWLDSLTRL